MQTLLAIVIGLGLSWLWFDGFRLVAQNVRWYLEWRKRNVSRDE